MPGLRPDIDPDGLLEYSVVYTDRALNHMSATFGEVMRSIHGTLSQAYNAAHVAVIPGSGTSGMESVARQFATDQDVLVIRTGWFSYRWTQILDQGRIASNQTVLTATPVGDDPNGPFTPPPIDEVTERIAADKPAVVFAPHVETSAGMILPDDYIRQVGEAAHAVGALFVLDCIASGAAWVDMAELGIDVVLSAPQKGWSGPPCAGLVMLSEAARARAAETTSTSFALDLNAWLGIMDAYLDGRHAYHATMPTESLRVFAAVLAETAAFGLDKAQSAQWELGDRVRAMLAERGVVSVAAHGYGAPGVVVSYTPDPAVKNGSRFAEVGVQIAGGVRLAVGEPDDFSTFRIGLFGLDKLQDVDGTVARLQAALDAVVG